MPDPVIESAAEQHGGGGGGDELIQQQSKIGAEVELQLDEADIEKTVIANKVTGTVKWFNVKSGYGFINRNDTKEDVFVHQTAIAKNNPKKYVRSVGDGEVVEFDVVIGKKGNEAANVTGPEGCPVQGSRYAADRRSNSNYGGRRFFQRRRPRPRAGVNSEGGEGSGEQSGGEWQGGDGGEGGDGVEVGGEDGDRQRRPRRPFVRKYYRRPSGGQRNSQGDHMGSGQEGDMKDGNDRDDRDGVDGQGERPRRPRFYRGYFRPRRPRNQDSNQSGTDNEGNKENEGGQQQQGQQQGPRPRRNYNRAGPRRPRRVSAGKEANGETGDHGEGDKSTSDKNSAEPSLIKATARRSNRSNRSKRGPNVESDLSTTIHSPSMAATA